MRQVSYGEKERIRQQGITRLSGRCEIAFGLSYFAYYTPGTDDLIEEVGDPNQDRWQYWWEDGFVADISFEGTSTVRSQAQEAELTDFMAKMWNVPVLSDTLQPTSIDYVNPANEGGGHAPDPMDVLHFDTNPMTSTVGKKLALERTRNYAGEIDWKATITLPAEYERGFLTTQGTNAKGRKFRLEPSPPGIATHDTIYCNSVVIRTIDGQPVPYNQPNVYSLIPPSAGGSARPTRALDTISYNMEATSYWGYWNVFGDLESQIAFLGYSSWSTPMRAGSGVIDPMGYYSRRRDHVFRYMTTGDLRLYKLWPAME